MDSSSGSSSAGSAGHKRGSAIAALADSSSASSTLAQERAPKKSRAEASTDAAGALASATDAASSAGSSSSSLPQQPPHSSFFRPVHTLFEELLPLLQSVIAIRHGILDPVEAVKVVQLQEKREGLQRIQAQLVGAPQLQQEMQPRIKKLRENIQLAEQWLAEQEQAKLDEQTILKCLRTHLARTKMSYRLAS